MAARDNIDPVNGIYPDGTTDIQRANCRVVYEDTQSYVEWRLQMGLASPQEIRPSAEMRQRVVGLFAGLSAGLDATILARPRDPWRPVSARLLSAEELRAEYAVNPVKLSAEALERPSVREAS